MRRRKSRRLPLIIAGTVVVVIAVAAAFEASRLLQPSPKVVIGPVKAATPTMVSITGFVQAPYPPNTLSFNSTTTGKAYTTPITETSCSNGAGGVCFVYFLSVPDDSVYNVTATMQGVAGTCTAGTVDVTTVTNYDIDVTC